MPISTIWKVFPRRRRNNPTTPTTPTRFGRLGSTANPPSLCPLICGGLESKPLHHATLDGLKPFSEHSRTGQFSGLAPPRQDVPQLLVGARCILEHFQRLGRSE